jgi:Holliday junction resolvase
MSKPDFTGLPLAELFLTGYLSRAIDATNFPTGDEREVLGRYEILFANVLKALGMTKEQLRSRPEFNFDSGNAANLEGGIAILRVVEALRLRGFSEIRLVSPRKDEQGADLTCIKAGIRICIEVKAVTKQSRGREGFFFEEQLYEKVREHAEKAARQLGISAELLGCEVKLIAYVVNWFAQSIYLVESDYQRIVNKLERHGEVESLQGVDGVLFITKMGQQFLFLNEVGKRIDVPPVTCASG